MKLEDPYIELYQIYEEFSAIIILLEYHVTVLNISLILTPLHSWLIRYTLKVLTWILVKHT